ncbi:MAG: SAM-dependent methyltransferase [Vicingaceae bacterium]
MSKGKLYLIPNILGEQNPSTVIPYSVLELTKSLKYFIVENIRTTRRFLKMVDKNIDIDALTFFEIDKHQPNDIKAFLQPAQEGYDVGLISEAGCPAIADPGALVVEKAHQLSIQVVPLVGPNSILLALMASGFNGQNFAFNGYLPIEKSERIKQLKQLEHKIVTEHQTQIFIETPYRNNKLIECIIQNCSPERKLCVAVNLTLDNEKIISKEIKKWKSYTYDFHKMPAVFLLY